MDHKTTETLFSVEVKNINSSVMSNLLNLLKKFADKECSTCIDTGGKGICTHQHCQLAGRLHHVIELLEEPLCDDFNNLTKRYYEGNYNVI